MPINSFLYPGAKVVPPFTVANSLRFNQPDDPDLKKTIGAPTSARKFSVSCWVKLSKLGVQRNLWGLGATSGATGLSVRLQDDDTLDFFDWNGSGNNFGYSTNQVFRDVSAWSHFLFAVDTEQSTAHNRVRIYHNGTEIEKTNLTDNPGDPSEDANLTIADGYTFKVGDDNAGSNEWDGYIAEFVYIDGLQLTPSSFGQFNDDTPTVWEPIDVTGLTFGNNGFYLDFEDSSNLGNDANGGTDLTETNIAATDQSTDTCSNNACTWNTVIRSTATFTQGNLVYTAPSSNPVFGSLTTFGVNSGKWYAECKYHAGSNHYGIIGVADEVFAVLSGLGSAANTDLGKNTSGPTDCTVAYVINTGKIRNNNNNQDYGSGGGDGDIINIALDRDNRKVYFGINGTYENSGNPGSGTNGFDISTQVTGDTYFLGVTNDTGASETILDFNFGGGFGQTAVSSGNSDANGYGNFEYAVPSGFYAWNSKNLAEFG